MAGDFIPCKDPDPVRLGCYCRCHDDGDNFVGICDHRCCTSANRVTAQQPDGGAETLRACSFCGSASAIEYGPSNHPHWAQQEYIRCNRCGAAGPLGGHGTLRELWNRCVPIPPASPEREAEDVIDRLDRLVRDGIGAVEFCLTENGNIGIWVGSQSDEDRALATGDTVAECIDSVAARKEVADV